MFNAKPQQNVAGKFDYYTLVMSWSPTHCANAEVGRDEQQCARFDGLRYGFVLHGLWPQYEKGYPEACRDRAQALRAAARDQQHARHHAVGRPRHP